MKNGLFVLVVLMNLVACKDKSSLSQSVENKRVDKIDDWRICIDKFKYKNLKSFELNTDSIEKGLVKIENDLFFKIIQDSLAYDNCYFYSFQGQDSNFTKITIVHKSLEWYSDIIWYLIYDKNNVLLNKTAIAENGLDEDWGFKSKSEFINDSTVNIHSIEKTFGEVDDKKVKVKKKELQVSFVNGKPNAEIISVSETLEDIKPSKYIRILPVQ